MIKAQSLQKCVLAIRFRNQRKKIPGKGWQALKRNLGTAQCFLCSVLGWSSSDTFWFPATSRRQPQLVPLAAVLLLPWLGVRVPDVVSSLTPHPWSLLAFILQPWFVTCLCVLPKVWPLSKFYPYHCSHVASAMTFPQACSRSALCQFPAPTHTLLHHQFPLCTVVNIL